MVSAAPRRADAARNDERILAGALAELGRDPSAGMGAIALACGVSRATLTRRYPTRDQLLAALRERAHADLRAAVATAGPERGTALAALARLVDALFEASAQYAFLVRNPVPGRSRRIRHVAEQVEALIRRGQSSGEFAAQAPPAWWVEVLIAVLQVATSAPAGVRRQDAARLATATLAEGLAARPLVSPAR